MGEPRETIARWFDIPGYPWDEQKPPGWRNYVEADSLLDYLRDKGLTLAANPAPAGLDVERLREALHAADPKRYEECYHGLTVSDCGIDAEDIARAYAALANTKEPDGAS